jgi:NAD(P)-dependent dehydrogenase (short-subunit alcohol dehydrogenase family)
MLEGKTAVIYGGDGAIGGTIATRLRAMGPTVAPALAPTGYAEAPVGVRSGRVRPASRRARIRPTAEAWPRDMRALSDVTVPRRGVTERARTSCDVPEQEGTAKRLGTQIRSPRAAALRAS